MKRWLLGVGLLLANLTNAHADIITQWNFNGQAPGVENSPTPSIGVGAASLVGGVTSTGFSSGTANGGSSDPALTGNFGWQTTTYAAQGTANRSRGVQFNVSTVGKQDIVVSFDLRHSNTSSRYEQFQYSLNGINFVDSTLFDGNAGDTWFNNRTVDLSSIAGVNNNANFSFRVVAAFDTSGAYAPSNSTATYATTGTWRFDMVTVNGVTAVPEPSSIALLSLVGIGGFALRRLRKGRAGRSSERVPKGSTCDFPWHSLRFG
jgi:hypothetical protein